MVENDCKQDDFLESDCRYRIICLAASGITIFIPTYRTLEGAARMVR